MVLFTISIYGLLEFFLMRYFVDHALDMNPFLNWSQVIFDIFYYIGNIMFYILLLLRVTIPFELNKYAIITFIMLIMCYTVSSILYLIVVVVYPNGDFNAFRKCIISMISIDLSLNVFILLIFARKIKGIIQHIDPSISPEAQKNVDVMANVIAKHCLLFGMAILFNQGFLVTVFIYTFMPGGVASFASDIVVGCALTSEVTVNVLVLWLILRVNYDKYICLCKCCHIGVAKCCIKNVDGTRVVQNPYYELLVEETLPTQQSSNPVALT